MGKKRNSKAHKATGQRKSATADKKNAQPMELPKPRPLGKSNVAPNEPNVVDTDGTSEKGNDEETTVMAVEALLAIQNRKPVSKSQPSEARKVQLASLDRAMEHVFCQVVPGCEDDLDDQGEDTDGGSNGTDSDEDAAEFPIPFEVPFKSAMWNLNGITLHTKFLEFLEAAAQQMETRLSLLASIAYVPSFKPKSPKPVPKLLEDDEDWETLLDDIDKYRVACMTKSTGKGTQKEAGIVKAFVIKIIDMSVSDEKVSKKGPKKPASESTQPASDSVQTEADLLHLLEKQHMPRYMKKTAHQPQPQPNIENLMQMMQQMMGMFMGGLAGSMALGHSPDKITPGPALANQDMPSNPTPSTGLKHAADSEPLPQNIDIEVWLSQLDTDPIRGN
ncbi:hypothetical protein L208DRAFT_1382873 [Tricholoma matsutake]|nr:hypothetical protein L208DRAFT_1382873 [Tricholoma matsutake 945]